MPPRKRAACATLILALVAVGCGSSHGSSGSKSISLVVGTQSDDYYRALECGASVAAKQAGLSLNSQGPKSFDTSLQVPIVDGVVNTNPKAILIAPDDSKALFPPLSQAHQNGAKIITVDTTLANKSILTSVVTGDWYRFGEAAGTALAQVLHGKGKVLGIFAPPGVTTNDLGREGFAAAMKRYPGIKVVSVQFSNGDPGKSASITSATLARVPDLNGILTFNGGDSAGVVTGLADAGKSKQVAFVSGDAQPFEVKLLGQGKIAALVVAKPYDEGVAAVHIAAAALDHKPVPKQVLTSDVVATKANMSSPAVAKYFYKPC